MCECVWCGKKFDHDDVEDRFSDEYPDLSYSSFRPMLCRDCAIQAIEDGADGVYFEECEECGATFDLAEETTRFASNFSWFSGTGLRDYWDTANKILCADCAMKYVD